MQERAQGTRVGLLSVIGAVVFTVTWVVLGFVSDGYQMWDIVVDPYSPIAQPISGLGMGSTAPVMNTAFVVCGALTSVGAWAAMGRWPGADRRPARWARVMVAASGVGMAMCGIFNLESIMFHTLGFLIATAVPGAGLLVGARALRGTAHHRLAAWLRVAGPVTLAGVIAFMVTFNAADAGHNVGVAGLIQRVLVTVMLSAVAAIGLTGAGGAPRPRPASTTPAAGAGTGRR
jgi:hypothetical protein